MRGILADLGLDLSKIAPTQTRGTGGPFIPANAQANSFDRQLYRIKLVRGHVERLNRTLSAVPIRKPLSGEMETTSGFVVRTDPSCAPRRCYRARFRATRARQRARRGRPVTVAGWNGGYGKMVEIDHGNGFATRILASLGDRRRNRADSAQRTDRRQGRLDRPLHGTAFALRTRVEGDPVDRRNSCRAGVRLGGTL